MSAIISVINIAAPLLLITLGALVSEYTGRLAMFLESIINAGAFLCYALTILTKSAVLGSLSSVVVCMCVIFAAERTASRSGANMFLLSLAMNLLLGALVTFFSVMIFNTRGVLYSDDFYFRPAAARTATSIACYALSAVLVIMLRRTRWGLAFRITGSGKDVLNANGISRAAYKCASWVIAAGCGAFAGCVLCLRLSSFVPGLSSGRGWTALAAVYLGRRHPVWVIAAVLIFAVAEYLSSHIQNIGIFSAVPSSVLLSMPYLLALALLILFGNKGAAEK